MSIRRTTTLAALLAAAATTLGGTFASPAVAKDGDVRARGTCTARATAKLKLSEEDGRIEVELEVDQNRNGIKWKVTVRRNGRLVARTAAITRPPSGSFTVRRLIGDAPGTDRLVAVATSSTGERCTARASF